MLKSDNPFEILEKSHGKSSNQLKQESVECDPQEFGIQKNAIQLRK